MCLQRGISTNRVAHRMHTPKAFCERHGAFTGRHHHVPAGLAIITTVSNRPRQVVHHTLEAVESYGTDDKLTVFDLAPLEDMGLYLANYSEAECKRYTERNAWRQGSGPLTARKSNSQLVARHV